MRHQLQQQLGQEVKQSLHGKAAHWYQAQPGMLDSAIFHALQAGDDVRAAKWIAQTAPDTLWGRGEATRLCRLIESLPPEKLTHYPLLSALLAWAYYISGKPSKASGKMARAVADLAQNGVEDQDELVMGLAAALQAFEARTAGDFEQSIQLGLQALAQLVDQNKMLQAILYFNLGAAYDHIGNLRQASEAAQKLLLAIEGTDNSYLRLEALGGLAHVAYERGQLHRAMEICQEALFVVGERPLPGVAIIKSSLANLFYEWNELEQSDKYAQEAIKLAEQSGLVSELPTPYYRRALIALHHGDETAVPHYRQQILQVIQKVPTPFIKTVLNLQIADLDLRSNHLDKAWRWLQTTDLLTKDLTNRANTLEMNTFIVSIQIAIEHCRVHSESDLLVAIVDRLRQLLHSAKNVGHIQFQIKIQLLLALTYDLQNSQTLAMVALKETFPLTEPEKYCRIFVDLGEPMANLILAIQKDHGSSPYIAELLSVFAAENLLPPQTEIPRLLESPQIEPLHKQEQAILRLMAAGLSNRQIAEELFLSVNTVKWYIKSLYEKLGVRNRVEAVALATELGLISP